MAEIESSPIMSLLSKYLPLSGGTMTGDLDIASHKITTINHSIKEIDANWLGIRNKADTAYSRLLVLNIRSAEGLEISDALGVVSTQNADGAILEFQARLNSSTRVNVARLVSAAEPYFEISRTMLLKPVTTSLTLEGQLKYDSTEKRIKYYDGAAEKALYADADLTTAISTSWGQHLAGTQTQLDISGQGSALVKTNGDGSSGNTKIYIDGTLVHTINAGSAVDIAVQFRKSLKIETYAITDSSNDSGSVKGNYA
ncbi:MAG TPA: hypothetical protein G4O01_02885 [Dehalococcoidia bacterium]|jgi:hypothetical protein|nr:hypothetical protein [Dehalococcoidia bacterium]